MNEFELIRRYFTRPAGDADVLVGIGDDAAVLGTSPRLAVTVDTLVETVHFPLRTAADAVGHRALAVNLSDIAAMGARPRWCLLALTLPEGEPAWLEAFAGGFHALAERYGVALVGGNLTHGPLSVTVTVLGAFADGAPLTRSGGRAGDDVYVTGTLGDGAGGLALLRDGGEAADGEAGRALIERFLRPVPRVEAGVALAGVASAAIDVSDGLGADLEHLCTASGCGADVDVERVPLSAELAAAFAPEAALARALAGGDDYELCFSAAPGDGERVEAAMRSAGTPVTRIGTLTEGSGIVWRRGGERVDLPTEGYLHF